VPELHQKQKQILHLLQNSSEPLSVRDLQKALEISSPSVVHHHILQLEKKGYIRRNPNNPQDYQILAENPDKEITYLNVYGLAQCGPNGLLAETDPIERVPISTKMLGFPSTEAFMVKARGNSMTPFINENDYVIAQKNKQPKNGDIVVCVNNENALIKKIIFSSKRPILESLNHEFAPIIPEEDLIIEGIVQGVYKYTL
jgi:repressor LexA